MTSTLKQWLRQTPLYYPLRNLRERRRQRAELADWERRGRPLPPPHLIKQRMLRDYARRYGLRILIETGTYRGDMVEALKGDFDRIYSIELGDTLHAEATRRFRKTPHVRLIHGDSGTELGLLTRQLDRAALFWLDGHYSAGVTARGARDTPILQELAHIMAAPTTGHVIVIDDARCFGTDPGYPSLQDLEAFLRSFGPRYQMAVDTDSVRITPAG